MPDIELNNISKYICNDINLSIRDGEFLVMLGSNGSGKTTLLNIIAGLLDHEGTVSFDGQNVTGTAANRREVSYLFQDLLLFPHMSVSDNVAYGMKIRKLPADRIQSRVEELLKLTKIEHLADRYPRKLSGGERQRAALARALATSPKVLLLDEPLSSLDSRSAKYLRTELKQIHRKLGITTVFVTHNLQEAEEMADRIAIIHNGKLEQIATPEEIFFSPASHSVSDFIGAPNILECESSNNIGHGLTEVTCDSLPIVVAGTGTTIRKIAILPSDIYISGSQPPGPEINHFKGRVTEIEVTENGVRIRVKVDDISFLVEIPYHIYENLNLSEGQDAYIILRIGRIRIYE